MLFDWCCRIGRIPLPVQTAVYVLAVTEDRNLSIPANHSVQSSNTITARPLGCLGNVGFCFVPIHIPEQGYQTTWFVFCGDTLISALQQSHHSTNTIIIQRNDTTRNGAIWTECYWGLAAQWLTFNKVVWKQEQTWELGKDIWAVSRLNHETAVHQQNKRGHEALVNRLLLYRNKKLPLSLYECPSLRLKELRLHFFILYHI